MKKTSRILAVLAAVILLSSLLVPALSLPSSASSAHVYDDANLLTSSEKSELETLLASYSADCGCFIAVMTTNYSPGGFETEAYNKVEALRKTEGDDILLLYVDMGTRDYRVESHGDGTRAGNDNVKELMERSFKSYLSSGMYFNAFKGFGKSARDAVKYYRQHGRAMKGSYPFLVLIIGMVAAGLISGAVYTGKLKKELKSVAQATRAANYVVNGSMNVTTANDIFLYTAVTKTPRPKETRSSSSGGGFSGGGGGGHGGFSGKF